MQNGNAVTKDEVITKLKDDGDFDRLRLKIIRRLKENEELRSSIVSVVKQSAALSRPGAENLKPRQLSDAIFEEIKDQAMSQISDGLWQLIRSPDGMKSEISETVQSVYHKIVNPNPNQNSTVNLSTANGRSVDMVGDGGSLAASSSKSGSLSDAEPQEPPGFSLLHNLQSREGTSHPNSREKAEGTSHPNSREKAPSEDWKGNFQQPYNVLTLDNADPTVPPGFTMPDENRRLSCGSDEDPPLPPGFA